MFQNILPNSVRLDLIKLIQRAITAPKDKIKNTYYITIIRTDCKIQINLDILFYFPYILYRIVNILHIKSLFKNG